MIKIPWRHSFTDIREYHQAKDRAAATVSIADEVEAVHEDSGDEMNEFDEKYEAGESLRNKWVFELPWVVSESYEILTSNLEKRSYKLDFYQKVFITMTDSTSWYVFVLIHLWLLIIGLFISISAVCWPMGTICL